MRWTYTGRLMALLLVAPLGTAQASAQMSVASSVTVLLPPTSGSGIRPLEFGTVTPGASAERAILAEADSTAAGVALFSFTGVQGNRDVELTFDLPTSLTHPGSGSTMPITFDGSYGLHCFDRTSGINECSLFNPSPGGATPSTVVLDPPAPPRSGGLRVYLGGRVDPALDLEAGTYQATVTVTLTRL